MTPTPVSFPAFGAVVKILAARVACRGRKHVNEKATKERIMQLYKLCIFLRFYFNLFVDFYVSQKLLYILLFVNIILIYSDLSGPKSLDISHVWLKSIAQEIPS
ncbi:hypothetical protein HanXRQr2_Chr10g0450201 [Helianthus annuus]|uniref:Uncharacterized protein n=1 Tax=Helianthus annuus TaxID=4232 RepID=A0A9K3N5G8_HELAN|nr:hypothetical protein HanXRQr2_Chr10g0450201 [Helianthus annuus]